MRYELIKSREHNNLTQREVAETLEISERTYQRYESGERIGDVNLWIKLSDMLGVEIREISKNT